MKNLFSLYLRISEKYDVNSAISYLTHISGFKSSTSYIQYLAKDIIEQFSMDKAGAIALFGLDNKEQLIKSFLHHSKRYYKTFEKEKVGYNIYEEFANSEDIWGDNILSITNNLLANTLTRRKNYTNKTLLFFNVLVSKVLNDKIQEINPKEFEVFKIQKEAEKQLKALSFSQTLNNENTNKEEEEKEEEGVIDISENLEDSDYEFPEQSISSISPSTLQFEQQQQQQSTINPNAINTSVSSSETIIEVCKLLAQQTQNLIEQNKVLLQMNTEMFKAVLAKLNNK